MRGFEQPREMLAPQCFEAGKDIELCTVRLWLYVQNTFVRGMPKRKWIGTLTMSLRLGEIMGWFLFPFLTLLYLLYFFTNECVLLLS